MTHRPRSFVFSYEVLHNKCCMQRPSREVGSLNVANDISSKSI